MIKWFLSLFKMLTPEEMLNADLVMAQREHIEHAKLAEYHNAMVKMLEQRTTRIRQMQSEGPMTDSAFGGTDD